MPLQENTGAGDPFGCIARMRCDAPGVVVNKLDPDEESYILFHSVVKNIAIVIDIHGNTVEVFNKTPDGYELYRPVRPGNHAAIIAILSSKKNRDKRIIAEINLDGEFIWKTSHRWFTHDFQTVTNGNIISVIRENREFEGNRFSDTSIIQLDPQGTVKWSWSIWDHVRSLSDGASIVSSIALGHVDNPFHVNSVQIANWPEAVEFFGEPVVVISARNISSVFVVGRVTSEILFELNNVTAGQHHARLIPPGLPGEGNLIVFDNGVSFSDTIPKKVRNSRVIEYSIKQNTIVWSYSDSDFFSPIVGGHQRLVNGNTFITEGYYGRLFEVNPSGEVVWDYTFPDHNDVSEHPKPLSELGLRQIYRAYKVPKNWLDGFSIL